MFCYVTPPKSNQFQQTEALPVREPIIKTEKVIDENNRVVTRQVLCDSSDHPLKGLKAANFELDVIVASGSIGLLKQMPLMAGDRLSQLDSIESEAEHLSTLNSSNNG